MTLPLSQTTKYSRLIIIHVITIDVTYGNLTMYILSTVPQRYSQT